jgi:hypothetical protein
LEEFRPAAYVGQAAFLSLGESGFGQPGDTPGVWESEVPKDLGFGQQPCEYLDADLLGEPAVAQPVLAGVGDRLIGGAYALHPGFILW